MTTSVRMTSISCRPKISLAGCGELLGGVSERFGVLFAGDHNASSTA